MDKLSIRQVIVKLKEPFEIDDSEYILKIDFNEGILRVFIVKDELYHATRGPEVSA